MDKKVCTNCNIEKEVTEFSKEKRGKFGVRSNCKVCDKQWREKNKEKEKKRQKEWRENNKDKIKEYREKNKEKTKLYINQYNRERKKNDHLFKLKSNVRNLISQSLKSNGYRKNSKTEKILGCKPQEFRAYIESRFEEWMTWDNYGLYNGELNYGWDLDHCVPSSSVNTEIEAYKNNHYTNFKPLCSYVNRVIKRDKILT